VEPYAENGLEFLYAGVLFIAGLLVGSFLNVAIYRLPLGLSLAEPPSHCPKCGRRVAARDNVPVLGWLFLGGKCRHCRRPISWRYPAVELITGLLWAWEGWRLASLDQGYWANILAGVLELAFLSSLVVTFLVDWDHQIILDEISLGGLALAVLASPWTPFQHWAAAFSFRRLSPRFLEEAPTWSLALADSLIGALAGLALSLGLYFLGNICFRRQIEAARREDPDIDSALGLGDVKLMAFYGAFFGWPAVFAIFFIAALSCALVGTIMKLRSGDPGGAGGWRSWANRWRSGGSVVPLGPFLAFGALVCHFFPVVGAYIAVGAVLFLTGAGRA
jgi:leader peptidase (prepilin peptidase)/N-methyltransferase